MTAPVLLYFIESEYKYFKDKRLNLFVYIEYIRTETTGTNLKNLHYYKAALSLSRENNQKAGDSARHSHSVKPE